MRLSQTNTDSCQPWRCATLTTQPLCGEQTARLRRFGAVGVIRAALLNGLRQRLGYIHDVTTKGPARESRSWGYSSGEDMKDENGGSLDTLLVVIARVRILSVILEIVFPVSTNYTMLFSIYTRSDLRSVSATAYSGRGRPGNSLLYQYTAPVIPIGDDDNDAIRAGRGWVAVATVALSSACSYPVPDADRQRCGGISQDSQHSQYSQHKTPPSVVAVQLIPLNTRVIHRRKANSDLECTVQQL
mgnify:FL=1